MRTLTRAVVVVAALLALAVFWFPLWSYQLEAPQYPEGLGMSIWIDRIGGQLNTINQLNHYIGMKHIDPDALPELRVMPWVIGFMCAAGLLVAIIGRLSGLVAWVGAYVLLGVGGLVDFYRWLYDYGHNLSPDAPISMEPFMPSMLGRQEVANFWVASWPDVGGIALMASALLAMAALALELWSRRQAAGA